MPVKPPPPQPVDEFDDGFKVVHATIRGRTYVLKELAADEYEKCLEKARDADGTTDNVLLLKLMLDKAMIEPKVTMAELWKMPYSIIRKLNDIINDIHFSYIETEEEKAEEAEDDEKGEVPA
jgi:hypothetical protein